MSALHNPAVPVRMEDSWAGLASNLGLLRLEGESLLLEFETKDEVLQVLKSEVKRIAVPLTAVEACRWKPGWFRGQIELSVHGLDTLAGVPGATQGRVTLHVARKDRPKAFGVVANVELALARRVVRAAEESGRR
jgi:hypothetical protein